MRKGVAGEMYVGAEGGWWNGMRKGVAGEMYVGTDGMLGEIG
jgi:hypothetical protein